MSTGSFLELLLAGSVLLVFSAWLIFGVLLLPYFAWFWWSRRGYRREIHAPMNAALREYRRTGGK